MYEGKPVVEKYHLKWYPVLKQAEIACERENKRVRERSNGYVYIWPRESKNEGNIDLV